MATSITAMKRVPAGTPTVVFTTGATESASMKFAVFGQAATANTDIKILPSSYVIPQDRFDATNFSKTAHPGGTIDPTWDYVTGEVVGGTTYNYLRNGTQYRVRNSSTNLFETAKSFVIPEYAYQDSKRNIIYNNYSGDTIDVRSYTAGTLNKFTDTSSLTSVVTRSGFTYSGDGTYAANTATGGAVTVNGMYTSWTSNMTSGTIYSAGPYDSGSYAWGWYRANYSGAVVSQSRLIVYGTSGPYVVQWAWYSTNSWMASIYGIFSTVISQTSGSTAWGQSRTYTGNVHPNNTPSTTDLLAQSSYAHRTINAADNCSFFMWTCTSYPSVTTDSSNGLKNQMLFKAYDVTSVSAIYHPSPNPYGYLVDATFLPIKLTSPDRFVFKVGAASGQTRYFTVPLDTSTTTTDYGATPPASGGGTVGTLSRPYNAKTLAVNYANYNQFKFTNGISDSDGLAYYTDGSGSYNTNGQSFWCKEGKYTLIRDESLKKLDSVSTDDYWFDRQVSMATGVRKEYTGITLAPGQSFWVTADQSVSTIVFGFKE